MTVRWITADVFDGLAQLEDESVDCVITSPPYWRKRKYTDDPREIGQESSPGEYLATMLRVTDELWRIVKLEGTIWFNIGDTAAGSGGWGGGVDNNGRGGGRRWKGTNGAGVTDVPLPKSVCWIPDLFGASLAYGRNLLTGEPCRQWITRPPVTWCKPSPVPGEIIDKFREATELFIWAAKQPQYYFDLDAVREPPKEPWREGSIKSGAFRGHPRERQFQAKPDRANHPLGVPPKTWWVINSATTTGDEAHIAVMPAELVVRPTIAGCPEGGTILDPFAGSGTVLSVATGHGRNAIGIDLDERNEVLAVERVGPLLWQS